VQRATADFLDARLKEHEELREVLRSLVDLLEARLSAQTEDLTWSQTVERLPLRRVATFVDYRGATPATAEQGVPLITASNIRGGRIVLDARREYLDPDVYVAWMRRGWPETGDVVITTEAPLGEIGVIDDPHVALAQRLILLKCNRTIVDPVFLAFALRAPSFQRQLWASSSGSTAVGVRADRLRGLLVPVPPMSTQAHAVHDLIAARESASRLIRDVVRAQEMLEVRLGAIVTAAVSGDLEIVGMTA